MDEGHQQEGRGTTDSRSSGRREVPVLRTQNSLIRDEFDSLRSRFDDEMRLMEQEMARFRGQMMMSASGSSSSSQQASTLNRSSKQQITRSTRTSTSSSTQVTTSSSRVPGGGGPKLEVQQPNQVPDARLDARPDAPAVEAEEGNLERTADRGEQLSQSTGGGEWRESFANSPLIVDDAKRRGEKLLKLRFDVHDYEPEKIVVKIADNRLLVHAEHEQRSENRSVFSEYNREFLLPAGTDPDSIASTLSADGVLTIVAPLP